MPTIPPPGANVTPYWKDVANQLGVNSNFWRSWNDYGAAFVGNLRYCARKAVKYPGDAADPTFDAKLWPTVPAGSKAVIYFFTGASVPGVYLSGTARGLEKFYRPGTYYFEVTTTPVVANPCPWFQGDGQFAWTKIQDQTSTQPAIYRVIVTEAQRSNAGIEMVLGGDAKLSNLLVYHSNDTTTKGTMKWAPDFINQLKRFNLWRSMEGRYQNELGADINTIAKYPAMDWCTWDGYGPAIEAEIAMCNEASLDFHWACPAAACLDVDFQIYFAQKIRDTLSGYLRVYPTAANEIWHGNGESLDATLRPAYYFQAVHAVTLGLITFANATNPAYSDSLQFEARMKAQSFAQRTLHDVFENVFQGQTQRVMRAVEVQLGVIGGLDHILNYPFTDGIKLGDRNPIVMLAPYYITVDTTPWNTYSHAWSNSLKNSFFTAINDRYLAGFTSAITGAQTVKTWLTANFPGCKLGTYEALFQDGVPNVGAAPDWSAGATYTYIGTPVYFQAAGAPGKTIHLSLVSNPTVGTFNPAQWQNTLAKRLDDYSNPELEVAAQAMAVWRSLDLCKQLIESTVTAWRTNVSTECFTFYKLFDLPGAGFGFRAFGGEREEPATMSTNFTYTGPWGPLTALQHLTLRPNGGVPGDDPGPGTGTGPTLGDPFLDGDEEYRPYNWDEEPDDPDDPDDPSDPYDPTDSPAYLDAINEVLARVHRQPVTTLANPDPEVVMAMRALDESSRRIQSRGWHFNTEYGVTLALNTANKIPIPDNTAKIDADRTFSSLNVTQRGKFLYDLEEHKDTFSGPIRVNIAYILKYDDLPVYAKNLMIAQASRRLEQYLQSDPHVQNMLVQAEMSAWADFEAAEAEVNQTSFIQTQFERSAVDRYYY